MYLTLFHYKLVNEIQYRIFFHVIVHFQPPCPKGKAYFSSGITFSWTCIEYVSCLNDVMFRSVNEDSPFLFCKGSDPRHPHLVYFILFFDPNLQC